MKASTTDMNNRFCYVYSSDLHANIQIKIGTLEGKRDRPSYVELAEDPMLQFSGACQEGCSDLYVTCQVFCDGHPLALPASTSYKAFSTRWNWNEWVTLPIKYSDLPLQAQLALTIWDIYGPRKARPVGGTTVSLFSSRGTFRQGMHDLKVWPCVEGDGNFYSTTPGKTMQAEDEMSRLAKLSKKHRNGHMTKVDWLDRLTFREIEIVNEKQKQDSNFMYLMIEFPHIHADGMEFSIVYFEMGGDDVHDHRLVADMVAVPDAEIYLENLVESKHHKLARSLRSGPTDRDLKPNAATRDQLNTIVGYPPTKILTSEEKDLVWKFRFYLASQKKALAKFLRSVTWTVSQEEKQALDLLNRWAPIESQDALELLAPTFTHPAVRKYAVARLQKADDEELLLYLLQLVQALKYESFEDTHRAFEKEKTQTVSVPVMSESAESQVSNDSQSQQPAVDMEQRSSASDTDQSDPTAEALQEAMVTSAAGPPQETIPMDLATFMISRACQNFKLANYLCWYLIVECDERDSQARDRRVTEMYVTVLKRFSLALNNGGVECRERRATIAAQQEFIEKLVKLVKLVARESGNRKKKIEKLQALLQDVDTFQYNFTNFLSQPLPLDPDIAVHAIIPEHATLFKSALMPCRFTFRTAENREYVAIFKHGDDLRQDQLVLQIITLMDKLLRQENLDLKLTPYKVLATSSKHGFVQFIKSTPVAEVLATDGSILNYFRKHAPSENSPLGVAPEIMENYVKSCAGYCVITYLLGVGDRHLDNLLLTTSGRLFHIDFGYILGRDPKPLPPLMKLSKEMLDAMGGTSSEFFTDFKKICYTAFLHLRRHANLFLNLFSLMVDANVPDIALEPDKTVQKVQDNFRLNLTDEEAVHYMQSVIDTSLSPTVAALMEQMHKIAQYWRK